MYGVLITFTVLIGGTVSSSKCVRIQKGNIVRHIERGTVCFELQQDLYVLLTFFKQNDRRHLHPNLFTRGGGPLACCCCVAMPEANGGGDDDGDEVGG